MLDQQIIYDNWALVWINGNTFLIEVDSEKQQNLNVPYIPLKQCFLIQGNPQTGQVAITTLPFDKLYKSGMFLGPAEEELVNQIINAVKNGQPTSSSSGPRIVVPNGPINPNAFKSGPFPKK